jgi:uncharacterized protein YjbI with pentapeptide repeats
MRNTTKNALDNLNQGVVIPGDSHGSRVVFLLHILLLGGLSVPGCDVTAVDEPEIGSAETALVGTNRLTANRLSPNGIGLNGIGLNGIGLNGIGLNGIGLNGIGLNGVSVNGIGLNGIGLNGIGLNGIGLNGIGLNGIGLNGIGLNGIGLNGIGLNGIGLNGVIINGIGLNAIRLNGIGLNGIGLNGIGLNGIGLNGVRLNGLSLDGIKLSTAKLDGTTLTGPQMSDLKLALSYVVKCALPSSQCVTVTDVNGSTYQLCGAFGLDTTWNTDIATSVTREEAVTQCVIDSASNDGHTVTHTNQERLIVKDFFNHAVSCALPQGTCVTATDTDGSTFAMCGSQGLDPAWQFGPPTGGAVAEQVASCVTTQASAHGDSWIDYRAQLKTVLQYAAECALRPDQSVTVTDWNGQALTWQGSLGLADWWNTAPLSPAPAGRPAAAGEELVSACLMARSNANGRSVSISLRARPELAADPAEAAAYGRHEGAFMGNLFSANPVAKSCSGPGGSGWLADPATNAPMTAGRDCAASGTCGFEYVGSCATVCNVKPGLGQPLFDECAGNSHVVNTFLYSAGGFDIDDTARTYQQVAGSSGDAPVVAAGDFNGDGLADLAIENNNRSVIVRLGKPEGGYAADVTYDLGGAAAVKSVLAIDLDADGDLDLVTANLDSLSVLLGNGDGTFGTAVRHPVANASGFQASVAAADFNNDGKIDLAAALASGVGVFLGNGDGTFGAQINTGAGAFPHSLTAADFNGDGKIDLASAYSSGASVFVSWGNGNGVFGPTSTLSVGTSSGRARSLTAGDFNGDGRADLAVAVSVDHKVRMLFGQSNKTFTSQTYSIAGAGDTTFVGAAYLDGDAARDLVVVRGASILVYSGSAGGALTLAGTFDAGEAVHHVAVGHFDRDSLWRLDLLASSGNGRLVQMNGL